MIVIKDFFADWCKPCKVLAKTLDEINDMYSDVTIKKYDIEDPVNLALMNEYKIKSVPYIRIEDNGVLVIQAVGNQSKRFFTEILDGPMRRVCGEKDSGCDFLCLECAVPGIEPEDCEDCKDSAEESGIEYEANFTHETGTWTCASCRQPV